MILILIAGFYIAWQFVPPAASDNLRIATSGEGSAYYQYALEYQQALEKEGVDLEIQTTAGSVEALQLLREGKVDVAFIQGGIGKNVPAEEGLHSIASLFYEPLWVFMRKDDNGKSACTLQELQGKRLAVGAEGSGTHALAMRLLYDNGIKRNNTELLSISSEEAVRKLETGEIDAAFLVSSPKSEGIARLTENTTLKIMNFQRHADAYTRHYRFLDALHLGEGALNLQTNVPDKTKTLLAATAALVIGPKVHSDNVRLLTREALRIHHKAGLLEKAWQFPSRYHLEIPIHPDAEQYLKSGPSFLEKYLPFSVAARLDQLKIMLIPLLTLLLPLAKGVMPLYKWRIRSRTYRWYKDINQTDRELENYSLPQTQQAIGNIQKLHGELAQEVSVPLSYMSEFYSLRMHTDHILNRLRERETNLQSDAVKQIPENVDTDNDTGKNSKTSGKPRSTSFKNIVAKMHFPRNFSLPTPGESEADKKAREEAEEETALRAREEARLAAIAERHKQANYLVGKHVATGMALSAVPIPMLDVAALTGTQLNLLSSLSEHYGVSFDRKHAKSILLSMLSGSLPTTTIMGLSSLSKVIPGIGTLGGGASISALSGAIIYATGKVFIKHFEKGGTLETFDGKQGQKVFRITLNERLDNNKKVLLEQSV